MKLAQLYPMLTPTERIALASAARLGNGYLWQIATHWRGKRPSLDAMVRLADADPRLTLQDLAEEFSKGSRRAIREAAHA